MGVVIAFPTLMSVRVMIREGMRARYDDSANWRRTASGRGSYIWLDPDRWVMVYQRGSGGWSWGSGLDADRRPDAVTATWSPETFEGFEAARRRAWAVVIACIERNDDGDAA
jgi:hypothetical protein